MMNLTTLFRRVTFGLMLAAVPLVGGCSDNNIITWTEDVKLLDGRVITVTQKRRIDMKRMPREAWLTFKLPEFGDKELVWHEGLETQVLNIYQGKLYVVGDADTVSAFKQYGRPSPSYVGFRYDNGQWVRIPFSEIPEEIYDTNMYFENMALYGLRHVSVEHKEGMLKEDTYMPHYKRIDPSWTLRIPN